MEWGCKRFGLRKTGLILKDGGRIFFERFRANFLDYVKSEFLMGFNMGFGTKISASYFVYTWKIEKDMIFQYKDTV